MGLGKGSCDCFDVVLLLGTFDHLSGDEAGGRGVFDCSFFGCDNLLAFGLSEIVEVGEIVIFL